MEASAAADAPAGRAAGSAKRAAIPVRTSFRERLAFIKGFKMRIYFV
jgi:hypothetical protein